MADGIYLGLMSGTSLDGVDGIAVEFRRDRLPRVLAEAYVPFDATLRDALLALQSPGADEIDREARAANRLATLYAEAVQHVLTKAGLTADGVRAVGVHGQTIRHRPEHGYTRQTNQPALLAELAGIDVIADFRSRDVAAGGQGAPLAPAFHAQMFGAADKTRVICNLGGISNITILAPTSVGAPVLGFDCGPANALLDHWAARHLGTPYDADGAFAARGRVDARLLNLLLDDPYFRLPPPKSTGRDRFNAVWLAAKLAAFADCAPADVQATLTQLTAVSVARDVARYAPDCDAVYVCGGGARNPVLLQALRDALATAGRPNVAVDTATALGVPPHQVEAFAFAWLAMRFVAREAGNLPAVTGAAGPRVLGALYPR